MDKQQLREFAAGLGINMLGIAPISRFEDFAPKLNPASIFPETKSVIVCGRSIPRGDFRGVEEGTLWSFPGKRIDRRVLEEICLFIENESGCEAVAYAANNTTSAPRSRPVREGQVIHNVSLNFEYAAVAAGLGEISFCGQLLTPNYGPRNALGIVMTELELEPDPLFEGSICDRADCRKCADICPSRAINPDKTVVIDICGKKMELADVNFDLCRICPNGAAPDFDNRIGQEELMYDLAGNQPKIVETSTALTRRNIPNVMNALCTRTCIAHLDDEEKIGIKYKNPFRTEKPWVLQTWER